MTSPSWVLQFRAVHLVNPSARATSLLQEKQFCLSAGILGVQIEVSVRTHGTVVDTALCVSEDEVGAGVVVGCCDDLSHCWVAAFRDGGGAFGAVVDYEGV